MSAIFAYVVANWATIISAGLSLVGFFSIVATMTPNTTDDKVVQYLLDIVNWLGANFGKATNKE